MTDGETLFEARNSGQLGVGGCLTAIMLAVFGGIPLGLVVMTLPEFGEAPVMLSIFYVLSLFPLAALYVLRRLMSRYRLRLERGGTVEVTLPFKTVRIAPGELAAVRTAEVTAATSGNTPMRRAFAHFIGTDRQVKASIAMSVLTAEQWQEFFTVLSRTRPDVLID